MSKLISSKHHRTVNFVSIVSERYSCGICQNIADEPMNCGNPEGCKGVCCSKCLSNVLTDTKACPFCSFEISSQPIKNIIVKDLIADEEVYCVYATDSIPACEWHGLLNKLDDHLSADCVLLPVLCSNEGCSEVIPRHDLPTHLASECGYRSTQCEHCLNPVQVNSYETHNTSCGKVALTCKDCGDHYIREDQTAHDEVCPDKLVTCPFARHGCVVAVLRKDFRGHQAEMAVDHSVLLAQRLSLAEQQMADNDTKHHLVTERLLSLVADIQHQMAQLESQVSYSLAVHKTPAPVSNWTSSNIRRDQDGDY